jgi:hypothetical protein
MSFYFASEPIPIQKQKAFLKEELKEAKKIAFNKEIDAIFASIYAFEQQEYVKNLKKQISNTIESRLTESKLTDSRLTESKLTKEIKKANVVIHKNKEIELAELNARISKNKEKKAIQLWNDAKIHAKYIEKMYISYVDN